MKFKKMVELAKENVKEGEEFKGMFFGQTATSSIWYALFGAFAAATIKQYIVSISDSGLYFNKLDLMGRPDVCDAFSYNEIERFVCKKGLLNHKLEFHFINGNKLKLVVHFRKNPKEPFLNQEIVDYLMEKIPC